MQNTNAVHHPDDSSVAQAIKAYLADPKHSTLAIIINVQGASYRTIGSMMNLNADGQLTESLSSGCIEADLCAQAKTLDARHPIKRIQYGLNSPYIDIKLPCGGGLEVLLLADPDRVVLQNVLRQREARISCEMLVNIQTGALSLAEAGQGSGNQDVVCIGIEPALRFLIFGNGAEALRFAALVQSVGYESVLLSPEDRSLLEGKRYGCTTHKLDASGFPKGLEIDDRSAVVLFFHDHDWEPAILMEALKSPAFYIGAQGSRRASVLRHEQLRAMGANAAQLKRLIGPIGLIPSTRDPRSLAVSVLAEILQKAATVRG